MPTRDELKARAQIAIDNRKEWIIQVCRTILDHPEAGFMENRTAKLVAERFSELGIQHQAGIALTGVKGRLTGGVHGPTVALIGELDSLRVPEHPKADPETGAAHACGHHAQIGMILGAAAGLLAPEVMQSLAGNVTLMAVPAEEFIDVEYRWKLHNEGKLGLMAGKQEFIRLGAFDDVDMAMMVHTTSRERDRKMALGGTSNGHLVKYIQFLGRAAHAGGAPHAGINALQAAMIALNAINAQRETMRNEHTIRIHGIMTMGGASVNSIPSDVRYEGRVRGRTNEAIQDANAKVDRCFRAGALAMGAAVNIVTIPGYLPMINNEMLKELFKDNAVKVVGDNQFVTHPRYMNSGGSTDMGDLSHIMPVIHPYAGGATGNGHSSEYMIQDYETAVINPAKVMAMAVIDLLGDDAARAKEILAKSKPSMTKEQYLAFQRQSLKEEIYKGR